MIRRKKIIYYQVLLITFLLFTITVAPLFVPINSVTANSNSAYTLLVRNLTPTVNPGDKVEIEIFLSGYGIPQHNKLIINWISPYIVDVDNPGSYIDSETHPINFNGDPTGIIYYFSEVAFMNVPQYYELPDYVFPIVNAELKQTYGPPLQLQMNTANTAPSGDYDISFIFTYGDDQNISQDNKTITFHVTSLWERNQGWMSILGVVITLTSLILTAVFSVFKPRIFSK